MILSQGVSISSTNPTSAGQVSELCTAVLSCNAHVPTVGVKGTLEGPDILAKCHITARGSSLPPTVLTIKVSAPGLPAHSEMTRTLVCQSLIGASAKYLGSGCG